MFFQIRTRMANGHTSMEQELITNTSIPKNLNQNKTTLGQFFGSKKNSVSFTAIPLDFFFTFRGFLGKNSQVRTSA